ncbi:MAG: diguanylate cyclase [Lachnospiraceae bacterium]|nr:diguanylate cyclase [Lachnospiraceae bacterium]
MNDKREAIYEIGKSLVKHFDSLFYVDTETGHYDEIVHDEEFDAIGIPRQGDDFFSDVQRIAGRCVHPDDVPTVIGLHDRKTLLKHLSDENSYSTVYRLIVDGKIEHVRNIAIMCEDGKHIICCLENIEEEVQEKTAQDRDLQSAKRLARLDDLTGIRNKNAFREMCDSLNEKIASGAMNKPFAVMMCDVNDLKLTNDTRGHSFGDEAIRRTSRLICGIFKHSPVFRVGGDEFVVILLGDDYDHCTELHKMLIDESIANKWSRSGPVVASGFSKFDPTSDTTFEMVYERADQQMYENKKELKSFHIVNSYSNMEKIQEEIPDDRKRQLDGLFGALITVAGGSYVYLNDMRYDFSRWSLSLVDDFQLDSEYMYHADSVWKDYIHPDDMKVYKDAVEAVLRGNAELRPICYRARKPDGSYVLLTTKGFVLSDGKGDPEYFGGLIIPQ